MAWPLYPGIILTVALADIPISALISKSWPGVAAMFGIGWFFFLRPGVLKRHMLQQEAVRTKGSHGTILVEGLPLIVAIVGAIGLESLLARLAPEISFEWGVIAALVGAIFCVVAQNRLGAGFRLLGAEEKEVSGPCSWLSRQSLSSRM